MKKVLAGLAVLMGLSAPMAWAEEDCAVPMRDWQPRDAVAAAVVAQGWALGRIRIDDGCYEVIATDGQGRPLEAKLNPATLGILDLEYEDEAEDDHEGHDD